jgi:hypothetical protein
VHPVDEPESERATEGAREEEPDDGRQPQAMERDHDDDAEAEDEKEVLKEMRF